MQPGCGHLLVFCSALCALAVACLNVAPRWAAASQPNKPDAVRAFEFPASALSGLVGHEQGAAGRKEESRNETAREGLEIENEPRAAPQSRNETARAALESRNETRAAQSKPRILLFVTTHMSRIHFDFLKFCWRTTIMDSPLLQRADVLVGATLGKEVSLTAVERFVSAVFNGTNVSPVRSVSVVNMGNPGYQEGAMLAFSKASQNRWFDGYDWVVRLNPDVIIRNDSWLLQQLFNEGLDGVFAFCGWRRYRAIMTDFTVFRPRGLRLEAFLANFTNAENQANDLFRDVVSSGRYARLADHGKVCRMYTAEVIHDHGFAKQCEQAFNQSTFLSDWNWPDMILNETFSVGGIYR